MTDRALEAFDRAVRDGDARRLQEVLAEHPRLADEIDAPRFEVEWPAVVHAANRGDREIVDVLLEHGADINARSAFWGRTVGVLDDSPPGMRTFPLERGALPEITEFVEAVRSGDVKRVSELLSMLELLLRHGPDLTYRNSYGSTPLGSAHGRPLTSTSRTATTRPALGSSSRRGSAVEEWMTNHSTPEVREVLAGS